MQTNKNIRVNFLTVLIGFAQIYAWATTYYLPAALTQFVAEELGFSTLSIVGGFCWALLIGGLCAPKIGAWIDKEGGRRPLSLGSLCMGVGLLIISQAHGLIMWYVGWTVIGEGMALGLFNATFASVGRLLGQGAKTVIIRITLISGFATLMWPLTTSLIALMGWRMMTILYAIPHIFIWAPLFFANIPKAMPEHDHSSVEEQRVLPQNIKWAFYLLAIYAVLRSMVGTTISVDILSMFAGLGLTLSAAAVVASFIGPAQIAGRILEMSFGSKFDPLYSSIFWTAVLPLAILILIVAGPSASSVFAIAYGMSNGVLTITMGILPMTLFGTKGYATMLGKLALPVLVAQAATPLLVDPMIQNWPSIRIFYLAGILGFASLVCLIQLARVSRN
jgi:MFS family permease